MAKPSFKGTPVTKAAIEAKRAERSAQRKATIAENIELKQNQTTTPKGTDYATGYGSSKEALTAFPDAISHDPGFHDAVLSHVRELRDRVGQIQLLGVDNPRAQKAGITRSVKTKMSTHATDLDIHLTAAENELARSFAAHQDGAKGGAQAYHTAYTAYTNAHKHLTDATSLLMSTGLMTTIADPESGLATRPLASTLSRTNLVTEYGNHLKQSALNKKVRLPKSVLSQETPNLSPDPESYTDVGQAELRRRNRPATPAESEARQEARQTVARKISISNFRETAMRGKYTPTLGEMQRNESMKMYEDGKPFRADGVKTKPNPFRGTGGTGYTEVAAAAKAHFERNNPGQSWYDSPHSKGIDVVAEATQHFSSANEETGKKFNVKTARSYLQKNAPERLHVSNSPAVKYAVQNNIGVNVTPENLAAKSLRLMGETKMAGFAGKLTQNKLSQDPTTPKAEKENLQEKLENITPENEFSQKTSEEKIGEKKQSEFEATPQVTPVSKKLASFSEWQNK